MYLVQLYSSRFGFKSKMSCVWCKLNTYMRPWLQVWNAKKNRCMGFVFVYLLFRNTCTYDTHIYTLMLVLVATVEYSRSSHAAR